MSQKNLSTRSCFSNSPHLSTKHSSYFDTYDRLLSEYCGKPITFLEIGVLNGGSLFMWREFFGPSARIIGVDLNPAAKKWEEFGFEIYVGSQTSPDFWSKVISEVGEIDVVLDDGGHTYEQQVVTVETLIEHVKDGGKLIVEDTHTSYMKGFGPRRYSFIEYTKNLMDRINHRSSQISLKEPEFRIWSIEVFESIVSFLVKRDASQSESQSVTNERPEVFEVDFRFGEPKSWQRRLNKLKAKLGWKFLFSYTYYFK